MRDVLKAIWAVIRTYIKTRRAGVKPIGFWCTWFGTETGLKLKLAAMLLNIDPDKILRVSIASGIEAILQEAAIEAKAKMIEQTKEHWDTESNCTVD